MRARIGCMLLVGFLWGSSAGAQEVSRYKQPSSDIVALLEAPSPPSVQLSPDGRWLLLMERPTMPTIGDLAQPMLRLAGVRINPRTNGTFQTQFIVRLTLLDLQRRLMQPVELPPEPRIGFVSWSPDGRRIAFVQQDSEGLALYVADPLTGRSRRLEVGRLNGSLGQPYQWLGGDRLLCWVVPEGRGKPPAPPEVPEGPRVQETAGRQAPVRTFQDLLSSPYDEALFEYYFTAQLLELDLATERVSLLGEPGIFDEVEPSPDGRYLFVARILRPYSYFVPYGSFPRQLEIWTRPGGVRLRTLALLPLAEDTPIGGVRKGPRQVRWDPTHPARLLYVEALDEGDPRRRVPHRDRLVAWEAPFEAQPQEWLRTEFRLTGLQWTERGDGLLVTELDRPTRKTRTFWYDPRNLSAPPRLLFDRLTEDRYNDPGQWVMRTRPDGQRFIRQSPDGRYAYLIGAGATPRGEYPFLRRIDLRTFRTEELFRSADPYYEMPIALLDERLLLTSRESASEPPNYFLRDLRSRTAVALTHFPDPQPIFRKVRKQLITYRRKDGIQLSGTLYLPPDYQPGERRPAFIWAYPIEFATADAAAQVSGSPNRFTRVSGASHLFLVLKGYVVLDNAAMPILGGQRANDTFLEQLILNAEAAIRALDSLGVADTRRLGVGGHSYGAFMTANLLAHSELFRAGIARSGAYNRTLTPFGFQNEERTLWEAPELYVRLSPFMHADKINEPLLLIHGDADNNAGTFPIQSERMYHALKGLGKTARLVQLPLESHGYAARESVLHVIQEMIEWMDRFVRGSPIGSGGQ
ncbi:MAG: prolyl oligopeptidase family serine peptidase [Bacteroidetes bacterium]|nr:prolyl oligopeptidase family serine peptidase [Rhodothermia bacterium]MCS7154969.1 prolyl oligopeptidase family serine peptidase [Bacteroidota bacterium]MCX7907253.1 prolyl oligopeptidase family serine peptidase [Bacteroidota bacterium]MDW8138021.1 prolyl oligopeptidase family serine peptidase [Bacteroidota bacterium]MDW8286127.1 prolyl oligopeptidase family serine peptidase [Bacteroidota bacterium]